MTASRALAYLRPLVMGGILLPALLAGCLDGMQDEETDATPTTSPAGQGTTSPPASPDPEDTTDPTLAGVRCAGATSDSVRIEWDVSDDSGDVESFVEYGASTSYGESGPVQAGPGARSTELSGLSGGTTYHFRVVAEDAAGNGATSADDTFATGPFHVHVDNFFFDPARLCVASGSSVTWHWHAGSHTVTIHRQGDPNGQYVHDEPLSSSPLQSESSYTFSEAGTFHYFCQPHSNGENGDYEGGMVGRADVD